MNTLSLGHLLALNDERFADARDHVQQEERSKVRITITLDMDEVQLLDEMIQPEIRTLEGRDTPVACEQDRLETLRGIAAKLEDGE